MKSNKAVVQEQYVTERSAATYGYELFSEYKLEANPAVRGQLLENAISLFHKALTIYPYYKYPISDLGAAFFCNAQYDSAEVYDLRAMKMGTLDATSRNNLSGVYLKTKNYTRDIDLCKNSMGILPHNGNAYADIGLSYLNLAKYDTAIFYLRKGISEDPGFYGCYDVLAYVYHTIGKPDSAKKYKTMAQKFFR